MTMRGVLPGLLFLAASAGCGGDASSEAPGSAPDDPGPRALPVTLEAGRFYVHPVTEAGDTLTFFTDTGGGLFLLAGSARRLDVLVAGEQTAALPPFAEGMGIPEPAGAEGGRLPLMGDAPPEGMALGDGMLGQAWFADRTWTFDYPAGRLVLWPASATPPEGDAAHRIPVGFQTDSAGTRTLSFPRVEIVVDRDTLDVLFDTGATVRLTAEALAALGDGGPETRATSFVTTSVLQGWLARNPDWRVVPDADVNVPGMRLVEVPEISVAGWSVGPVWFTERPDRNFRDFMSGFMDRPVEGALGGSGLSFFRVTLDYPRATALFEKP